jgi:acyl transferase domain-containing protein
LEDVVGTQTSVFIGGGFAQDYLHSINQDTEMVLKMKATGTSTALLSNRVSWFYDLKGTSMTIDTACSSSLVALHQACQDLRSGQAETVRDKT